jgi:UDP-N-acetylmuramate dehydrogenase
MGDFAVEIAAAFGERARRDVSLASYTTFRVGGSSDWFLETRTGDEIVAALRIAHSSRTPVTILGGGSNVLISDHGIRGLVVRPRGGDISRPGHELLTADAAVTMNGLVRWSIVHGAAGLEAWAGTPGTVGGAIYGNAHFGGRLISERVDSVKISTRAGQTRTVPAAEMAFGYDRSRLQETGEVLLSANFRVSSGDPGRLRVVARESLAFRKGTQPLHMPSAGCIFQNPQRGRDEVPEGIPWSAGALVDRAGLKGARVGGAFVSTTHGNFIVNDGSARSEDIRELIELCRKTVRDRFGVALREEIVYLGDFERP